ncbi:ATP-dependent RNA helicase abstrakt [Aduncisulcus paluster]|uniref:RNA helicase n=1 Tax=Aduncisulcus paluster TaxID=2918883 RepID=A0ABQ5JTH5_9EUKA|nr:ATP-dependent RNA helicase abstrakt [Aduncisulcus paluster]
MNGEKSLLEEYLESVKKGTAKVVSGVVDEETVIQNLSSRTPLKSASDRKSGGEDKSTSYIPLKSSWNPSSHVLSLSPLEIAERVEKLKIDVSGDDIPAPCMTFQEMKFPKEIYSHLISLGISKPSPIQSQALPVVLKRRDMLGISYTGSGKTLAFALPAVLFAIEAEMRLHFNFRKKESPFALLLAPSRELAVQTQEVVQHLICSLCGPGEKYEETKEEEGEKISPSPSKQPISHCSSSHSIPRSKSCPSAASHSRFPMIYSLALYGGTSVADQYRYIKNNGAHVIVATPGRLVDMLRRKYLTLSGCRFLCLDEADRLLDPNYESDIRSILSFCHVSRQLVLFSATMPIHIRSFAKHSLTNPIIVNVGRAGIAALNVTQRVKKIRREVLLFALEKEIKLTPPPVLVFSAQNRQCDEIFQHLRSKGVKVGIAHTGLTQQQRLANINLIKHGELDVLVASEIVSKGIDIKDVSHVINVDLPPLAENYIHRIGRTGRGVTRGIATTFITGAEETQSLVNIACLLVIAGQKVPPYLAQYAPKDGIVRVCSFCNGYGHELSGCMKYRRTIKQGNRG